MSNFNFYKAEKAYGEIYLQFPKVLLTSPQYKSLSDSAKIAYMIFKDRFGYSLRNNWIDKKGDLYFIYTNEELTKLLGKSKNTVTSIKRELEEAGLLLQKKNGFNHKTKKNNPSYLYLADLEVTATDVYQLQKVGETFAYSGLPKDGIPVNDLKQKQTLADSGLPKNGIPKIVEETHTENGLPKNGTNLYRTKGSKDIKDFKDLSDKDIISKSFNPATKIKEQEQALIESYITNYSYNFVYGEPLINTLKMYSFNDFATFKTYCNKLEFSHKSVEEEQKMTLSIYDGTKYSDYIRNELKNTFMRCIMEYRKGKAKDIASYLFTSFKNDFESLAVTVIKEKTQQKEANRDPVEF